MTSGSAATPDNEARDGAGANRLAMKPRDLRPVGQKDAILVLGMHRSGTSALSGIAAALGATPPSDLMPTLEENPKGFWESVGVQHLNEELLAALGSNWYDWREIDKTRFQSATILAMRERAAELVRSTFNHAPQIVLKDPRICRLLPFWSAVLSDLNYTCRNLIVVRSPMEVAKSLQVRNRFEIELGLLSWLRFVLDSELHSRGTHRSVVMWKGLRESWRSEIVRVEAEAEFKWPGYSDVNAAQIDTFVAEELVRQRYDDSSLTSDPRVHTLVSRAYAAVEELSRQPGSNMALKELDEIRLMFNCSSSLFGPYIAKMDLHVAAITRELSSLKESFGSLRLELADSQEAAAEGEGFRGRSQQLTEQVAGLEASLRQAQADWAALEERNAAALKDHEELAHRTALLEQEACTEASRANDLGVRVAELTGELETVQAAGAGAAAERDAAQGARDELAQRVAELTDALETARAAESRVATAWDAAQRAHDDLTARVTELTGAARAAEATAATERDAAQRAQDQLTLRTAELAGVAREAAAERDTARRALDEVTARVAELTGAVEAARAAESAAATERDAARSASEDLVARATALAVAVAAARAAEELAADDRDTARWERDELTDRVESLWGEAEAARSAERLAAADRDAAQGERDQLTDRVLDLTSDVERARATGCEAAADRDAARWERDELAGRVITLAQEVEASRAASSSSAADRDAVQLAHDHLAAELDALRSERERLIGKANAQLEQAAASRRDAETKAQADEQRLQSALADSDRIRDTLVFRVARTLGLLRSGA